MLLEFPAPIGKLEGIGELTSTIGELASTPISAVGGPSVANAGQIWISVIPQWAVMGPLGFHQGSVGSVVCWGFVGSLLEVCQGSVRGQSGVSRGQQQQC